MDVHEQKADILAMFVSDSIAHDRLPAIPRVERRKLTFSYPAVKAPPLGLFEYNLSGNGDAYVEFTNNGYHYILIDPLRSTPVIRVLPPGASGKETEITCGPNHSLQINFTMRLMSDFGLLERD
jgi:hypothetical protein